MHSEHYEWDSEVEVRLILTPFADVHSTECYLTSGDLSDVNIGDCVVVSSPSDRPCI